MYTCWDEEEGCGVSEEMKGEEAENREQRDGWRCTGCIARDIITEGSHEQRTLRAWAGRRGA